jgi:hypothetical protein
VNPALHALDTLYATGHWLVCAGRHRDALSLFRTMLLVDARDERGWLGLALSHEALDEHEKAIVLCKLAANACEGGAIRCTIARARMQRLLGADAEACDAYREAARLADEATDHELASMIAEEGGVP